MNLHEVESTAEGQCVLPKKGWKIVEDYFKISSLRTYIHGMNFFEANILLVPPSRSLLSEEKQIQELPDKMATSSFELCFKGNITLQC